MSTITPRRLLLDNGDTVVIRNPNRGDAAGFVEIMRSVASEGRYTLAEVDEVDWTIPIKRADIDEHNQSAGYLALVAEGRGIPVGFLEFENGGRRRTQHVGIFSIFISRDWRGKGVGSTLIKMLLDWATAHPVIEKVTLEAFATNKRAIALYEKFGFQVEGRCQRDIKVGGKVGGLYIDSLLMYKFVKPFSVGGKSGT